MRLSTVFELLLIFLLIAFAAYGRVIDRDEFANHRSIRSANESRQGNMGVEVMSLKQAAENVNKYCTCNTNICNCCRNFNIPIVQLKGPGCASLQYLEKDNLAVQLSMGDNILTSTVVNGQKPKAVCFPMPGGLTKFCGRIYSIQREADNHFKACLGLELQSSSELEAALRVSCFRFGPDGVKLRPAEQLPIVEEEKPADDSDDDDDIFGLGDDDDDDDDDDDEDDDEDAAEGNAVPDSSTTNDDDDDDDDDEDLGFGALLDFFTGDDGPDKKKKPQTTTAAPLLPFTIPILTKPTIGTPSGAAAGDTFANTPDNIKPITTKPEFTAQSSTFGNVFSDLPTAGEFENNDEKFGESGTTEQSSEALPLEEEENAFSTDASAGEVSASTETVGTSDEKIPAESLNGVEYVVKPEKPIVLKKVTKVVKKKPSLSSDSPNAIKNDVKKPVVSSVIITKPIKLDTPQTYATSSQNNVDDQDDEDEEEEEDDDDDDILGTSELDDDDEEDDEEKLDEDDEKIEDEKYENENAAEEDDEKNGQHHEDADVEDLLDDDDDDDDDEEEEAVLGALAEDDEADIKDKVADNEAANNEEDDPDYGLGLAEFLARKRPMRSGRQSKVMRL